MLPMSAAAKLPIHMSVREFLVWDSGDFLRYELVNGEPRAMAPGAAVHALLQNELGRRLGNHLRERGGGCDVLANPGVVPHLLSAHNFRVPGLGVTCSPVRLGQAMITDPVLLVEMLSPSNQADAWSNVWTYTSIPSVKEILVLHSARVGAEILRRSAGGAWPEEPEQVRGGTLELASVGFRVAMAELYARTGLAD